MESAKQQIKNKAKELGADDIAFVHSSKKEGITVIVLFFKYAAPPPPKPGFVQLSPYYIASNRGYHISKKLVGYITALGFKAQLDTQSDAIAHALKSGGFTGSNGFYYHRQFGSLVNIQLILTDAAEPEPAKYNSSGCLNCRACIEACPSAGVENLQNCLRYHSNLYIPGHLRENLYQLLGCELCQTACPLNNRQSKPVPQFKTEELAAGGHLKELQELAGKNMARKQRILSQAAIYCANTKQKGAEEPLKELSQNAPYPVKEHAKWALEKLTEDG